MYDSERGIETYSDLVYRIVRLRLPDSSLADDAYQNTFLHWLENAPDFKDAAHEKAWFIRCAINCANDMLRDRSRRKISALDECLGENEPSCTMPEYTGIFDALRRLPSKYSTALYLHYVEGYDTAELAKILRMTGSGARMRLKRGRELLLKEFEGNDTIQTDYERGNAQNDITLNKTVGHSSV